MKKSAEAKAKAELKQLPGSTKEAPLDRYAEFEKKAGIKIKDDLLPAFGNEIALAGSLKSLQGMGGFNIGPASASRPSSETGDGKDAKDKKGTETYPMLLIAVRDREATRRLTPGILEGAGIGGTKFVAEGGKPRG